MTLHEVIQVKDEALDILIDILSSMNVSTGYCCCGSSVESHNIGSGHPPVDEGEYHTYNALDKARKARALIGDDYD